MSLLPKDQPILGLMFYGLLTVSLGTLILAIKLDKEKKGRSL